VQEEALDLVCFLLVAQVAPQRVEEAKQVAEAERVAAAPCKALQVWRALPELELAALVLVLAAQVCVQAPGV
jgi:hypothetical protein